MQRKIWPKYTKEYSQNRIRRQKIYGRRIDQQDSWKQRRYRPNTYVTPKSKVYIHSNISNRSLLEDAILDEMNRHIRKIIDRDLINNISTAEIAEFDMRISTSYTSPPADRPHYVLSYDPANNWQSLVITTTS